MTKETQAWIKELQGNSIKLGCYAAGALDSIDGCLQFHPSCDYIDLNGSFTIEQLEALLSHMKQYSNEKE